MQSLCQKCLGLSVVLFLQTAAPLHAQSALDGVNLSSPEMSESEFTRDDIISLLQNGAPIDLTRRRLNGLDLSGLDLTGAILRAARMNNVNLRGAILRDATLDQAWMMNADLTGADLTGANLFQTQLRRADLTGSNMTDARTAADFSWAILRDVNFTRADFSADMTNQSMGLMRGVLRKATAQGANFADANLMRADLEFANLKGANFENANLMGTTLAGADFSGANVAGAVFADADVTSTQLTDLVGATANQFEQAQNLDRAFQD